MDPLQSSTGGARPLRPAARLDGGDRRLLGRAPLAADETGSWSSCRSSPGARPGRGRGAPALHAAIRKLGHLTEYGILAALWLRGHPPGTLASRGPGGHPCPCPLRRPRRVAAKGSTRDRTPAAGDVAIDAARRAARAAWPGTGGGPAGERATAPQRRPRGARARWPGSAALAGRRSTSPSGAPPTALACRGGRARSWSPAGLALPGPARRGFEYHRAREGPHRHERLRRPPTGPVPHRAPRHLGRRLHHPPPHRGPDLLMLPPDVVGRGGRALPARHGIRRSAAGPVLALPPGGPPGALRQLDSVTTSRLSA